jgi:hypothetical protein
MGDNYINSIDQCVYHFGVCAAKSKVFNDVGMPKLGVGCVQGIGPLIHLVGVQHVLIPEDES